MILTVSRAQTASQSEPCLDNNHIIPTQEHRQKEKHSDRYCTLTSVWPLKFLPTRRYPPQLKEDIRLERTFTSCEQKAAETDTFPHVRLQHIAARVRNYGTRLQSVIVSAATAVPVMKQWHICPVRKTKKSDSLIKIFDSHYSHLCNCRTKVYLCSDWLAMALSGLCQAEWVVQHTSATPPQPSISLSLSCLCTFHLTNVQEQAAPAVPWEAGRGGMDRWGGGWIW